MIATETLMRLKQGDANAFGILVQNYQQEMLCLAYRIVGQQADAEEIRQHVLIRIWECPERMPGPERFEAWLRRCVINESITWLRKRKRENRRNAELAIRPSIALEYPAKDELELLRGSLAKLEPEQCAMLSLKFDRQLTVREIGRVFNQSHTTVQSKLKRAIENLRSLMQVTEGGN